MPTLSMMRMPLLDRRSFTKRFSASTQKRWVCRFGTKRRLVRFFACDTLLPTWGLLPVTIHTLDMGGPRKAIAAAGRKKRGAIYTRRPVTKARSSLNQPPFCQRRHLAVAHDQMVQRA